MIPDHLRIQPGQQTLTPAQEAEARRFAQEYIRAQLSTEPVDEQEAEAFLRQAYQAAGLNPPQRIHWLDGPLQLVAVLAPSNLVGDSVRASVGTSVRASVGESVGASMWANTYHRVEESVWASARISVRESVGASTWASVGTSVRASMWDSVYHSVQASVWDSVFDSVGASVQDSVQAYHDAPWLACYQFLGGYLAPNDLQALAHFNALVSGYRLGQDTAVLVRRPARLLRDSQGHLHSATGTCLEYRDGWGFYAWHGVRVPEQVILAPERLSREDFLKKWDVEVRRVIQERMGSRFVSELGGVVMDRGPRGTLYQVALPRDPDRVARYVQVQDASSERQYVLRVPPTVQTVAEAVAWTFQVGMEDYHPTQET
jgi:hypothetical protein